MARCEECKANKVCDHNRFGFENCGNFIPNDVVPKSEADEIAEELSDTIVMKDELFDEVIKLRGELANAKAEVAREIFEEIERFLYMHFRFCKEEIGNYDTEYVKCRMELNTQIQNFIAEFKKKYIGEIE